MDIYKNKSYWKILLAIIGIIIVLISMFYSQYLATKLAEREDSNVKIYLEALGVVLQDNTTTNVNNKDSLLSVWTERLERKIPKSGEDNELYQSALEEIYNRISQQLQQSKNKDFILAQNITGYLLPQMSIITESEDGIFEGSNIAGMESTKDQELLARRVKKLKANDQVPMDGFPGYARYIYYEKSRLYHLIRWFPLAQIFLLGTFIFFSYYLFSASRKSEQNRVWAGMAKETAHQLGTPISAILGWIEHLKDLSEGNPEQDEVVAELRNDVTRLELIADRFSKIGSKPELEPIVLNNELLDSLNYMKRRAPSKVGFFFSSQEDKEVSANINSHLFNWVIENLLRNALDAMGGKGQIQIKLSSHNDKAIINLTDDGKGISAQNLKSVFNPGFTTKKRGWGLGLSLAKRIIENYHNGKIFVKHSKIDEGTTFEIQLPLA